MSQWEQPFYIHKMNNTLKDELHSQELKEYKRWSLMERDEKAGHVSQGTRKVSKGDIV